MTYKFTHPSSGLIVIIERTNSRKWEYWVEWPDRKGVPVGGITYTDFPTLNAAMADAGVTGKDKLR